MPEQMINQVIPCTGIYTVTPELAERLLAMNTHNRKIRNKHVSALARQLVNGEWVLTASGIGISADGVLLDGQHRLAAIVEANIPAQLLIATGLDPRGQSKVDRHSRRSLADVMTLEGCAATKCAVQCAVLITMVQQGDVFGTPDDYALRNTLSEWKDELELVDLMPGTHDRGIGRTGFITAFVGAFRRDRQKAKNAFISYATGANAGQSDPMLRLRNRAIDTSRGSGGSMRFQELSFAVYALRKYFAGEPCQSLRRDKNELEWFYPEAQKEAR